MKYFKNTTDEKIEFKKIINKNEDPFWDSIVKLFGADNGINIKFQDSLENIANRAREFGRQKDQEEYERLYNRQKPYLEDNSNDTNF